MKTIILSLSIIAFLSAISFFSYRHGKGVGANESAPAIISLYQTNSELVNQLAIEKVKTSDAAVSCFDKATRQAKEMYDAQQKDEQDRVYRADALDSFFAGVRASGTTGLRLSGGDESLPAVSGSGLEADAASAQQKDDSSRTFAGDCAHDALMLTDWQVQYEKWRDDYYLRIGQ